MAKVRTVYVCQNCGRQSPREMGRCPACGEYNTMVQEIIQTEGKKNAPPRPNLHLHPAPPDRDRPGSR